MKQFIFLIALAVACATVKGQRVKIRPFESVITQDAIAYKGLFTVYAVRDSFFFEIPDTLFNREIMAINQSVKSPVGTGGDLSPFAPYKLPGETIDSKAIYFDAGPDSTINIQLDRAKDQAAPGSRIAAAVKNAGGDPVLASFPIVAVGKDHGSYVVNATSFLKNANLVFSKDKVLAAPTCRVEYIHAYPMNMEFGIYQVANGQVSVINASLIALPRVPMQPRIADRRVGFFGASDGPINYFSDDQQKVEQRMFIARWRLEPRPEDLERYKRGELVEPAKPIVFYIDPNTPKQWVKYLILGVNDWQKAFEQAGFKNAVMAKEWPEGRTVDLHDARYSFICYLPSETANAYGPHVSDPRSGEIISSHVGWYHNVMTILNGWYKSQAGALDARARTPEFDDDLMGQLIRFVSSHEVGHTLGLAHNHGASSQSPVEKLRDKEWLKVHGHTVSIMDYARFNYVAQPEDSIPEENLWPHIGEYDRWAMQWGYTYTGAATVEEDKLIMGRLATDSLAVNPRLWFGNEEMELLLYPGALPNDPRIQAECLGDNNMTANAYGIRNFKRVLATLPTWSHEENGRYEGMAEVYKWMLGQYKRFLVQAEAHIGGRERTYKSEETAGDVYAPTSKALQQQALAFLDEELFTTPTWLIDPGILNKIIMPEHIDVVGELQTAALKKILDVVALNRLNANVLQFGPDAAYPLEEYFDDLHRHIWGMLTAHQPMDLRRRNLQMSYVNDLATLLMGPNVNTKETDYWSLAYMDLRRLQNEIDAALPGYASGSDRDYLEALAYRIKKIFRVFNKKSF